MQCRSHMYVWLRLRPTSAGKDRFQCRRADNLERCMLILRCTLAVHPPAPLTSCLGPVPLPSIVCLFLQSNFLLLDVARRAFPVLHVDLYGTIYIRTLPPPLLCLHLSNDLMHTALTRKFRFWSTRNGNSSMLISKNTYMLALRVLHRPAQPMSGWPVCQ